jgi:hypothetical protein
MKSENKNTRFEAIRLFIDFLANHPTDEDILKFTFPERIQDRIQKLVTKNNAGEISKSELDELLEYERLDTYGRLLKTKIAARQKISVTA